MPILTNREFQRLVQTPASRKKASWKDFPSASAAGVAVMELPISTTIQAVIVHLNDATNDFSEANFQEMIDRIILRINGIAFWSASGREAAMFAELYYPGSITKGNLPIMLHQPRMQVIANQQNLAWGLLGKTSAELEIHFNANHDAAEASCHVQLVTVEATEIGEYVEARRISKTFSGTGSFTFDGFPTAGDGLLEYYAIHLDIANKTSGAIVENVKLHWDGFELFNGPPDEIHAELEYFGFEPQTDFIHLLFTRRNLDADAVPMNTNPPTLELEVSTQALNQVWISMEIAHRLRTRKQKLAAAGAPANAA